MSSREETKTPPETTSGDWAFLPWRKLEQHVYRLQKRIYRASERGNVQAVHRLQQLLMRSRSAQLLAVRRVTQDNQGKKTAGVDGKTVLTPNERLELVRELHPARLKRQKPRPVRRVWIPKPGKTEKRPLGIPTIRDRARQALVKLALEPEWEAKFEPNSYGFRPGRGCHDAIGAIHASIKQRNKFVLDADIAGCFDHIDQKALLEKLNTYPALRRTVRAWLKAGVMEGVEFSPTEEGTPQGGVVSPLLANIALHGMETAVLEAFGKSVGKPVTLIRYADDFVVFHPTQAGIEKAKEIVETWLKGIGLELKPAKTRITQTLEDDQGKGGFDFLGMTIRQYRVGKTHTARGTNGKPLGYKTLVKPSKEAIKRHMIKLARAVRKQQAAPQEALIAKLNPIITGWANYHRPHAAKKTFSSCDNRLYQMLHRWGQRRHPGKRAKWVVRKYWVVDQGHGWTFTAPGGSVLKKHAATAIRRHVKVKGTASPYDGNLVYWAQRLTDHPLTNSRVGYLLKEQKGRCAYCGLYFREEDLLETDHIIPKRLGGKDEVKNMQVLHRHCHDQKTAKLDAALAKGMVQGITDKDYRTEEPCAAKVASTVLERQRRK